MTGIDTGEQAGLVLVIVSNFAGPLTSSIVRLSVPLSATVASPLPALGSTQHPGAPRLYLPTRRPVASSHPRCYPILSQHPTPWEITDSQKDS